MAIKDRSRQKFTKTYTHKGKPVNSLFNSREADSIISKLVNSEGKVGYIPNGFSERADLISSTFYSTPELWWAIMESNSKADIFEDLKVGDRIKIPKL